MRVNNTNEDIFMIKLSDTSAIPHIIHQLYNKVAAPIEAREPVEFNLNFTTLSSALLFRDSLYGTRHLLRRLYKDNPNEYSQFARMHRILEKLSISRVDRVRFEAAIETSSTFPVTIRCIDDRHSDIENQLNAIAFKTTEENSSEVEIPLDQDKQPSDLYDIPLLGIQIPRDLVVAYQATEALDWLASQPTSTIADYNAGLLSALPAARFSSKLKLIRENPSWFLIDPFALYSEDEE